jgi:chloride channel 7
MAVWAAHLAFSLAFGFVAFACVLVIKESGGSGLPRLLAYLNGCKLHKFTSIGMLFFKFVGTTFALSGGFFCGPEGPIIHIGACCGKLLLRSLYKVGKLLERRWPNWPLGESLSALKNDLDERDFVAIGAGAGVAAAFSAPISATLFVVEEAASHFSLPLLWRTFAASIIALWVTHLLNIGHHGHEFHVTFELGSSSAVRARRSRTREYPRRCSAHVPCSILRSCSATCRISRSGG